ncbi:MAG: AAA family ATPase [Deltaproteobacteria bacterium]|nr:AAA family ATPase [Deltaproteobacteria bacterium]
MIPRTLGPKLGSLAARFPVVFLTGPRQSGKTTLARATFPDFAYVSLEDLDERGFVLTDPRGFLRRFDDARGAVLDEVQRAPDLLSYLQARVDRPGSVSYVLTGSQQLHLAARVSQTLAGRAAVIHRHPFALSEVLGRARTTGTATWGAPPNRRRALGHRGCGSRRRMPSHPSPWHRSVGFVRGMIHRSGGPIKTCSAISPGATMKPSACCRRRKQRGRAHENGSGSWERDRRPPRGRFRIPPPAAAQASCGNVVASASLDGCSVPGPPDWNLVCSGGASAQSVPEGDNCWLVLAASASMAQRCEASHLEQQLVTAAGYEFEARLKVTDLAPQCSCQDGYCGCMVTTFRASDGDRMPMLNISIQPGNSGFVTFFDSSAPYGWLTFLVDIAAVHTYRVEVQRGGQVRVLVDGVVLHSTAYANLPAAAYVPPGLEWFIDQWATVWIDRVAFDVCGPTEPPAAPLILTPRYGLVTNVPPSTVTGEAESGTTVLLFDNGVLVASGPATGGTFSVLLPAPLADGFHVLTARAQRANQVSLASKPVAVTVDTTAPPAPVVEAPKTGVLESTLLFVGGSAEADADVTVTLQPGGSATATADGAGRFLVVLASPVASGQVTITARATDAAGNESPTSPPITVSIRTLTALAPKVSPRGAIALAGFSANPAVFTPGGPAQALGVKAVITMPKAFRQSAKSNHQYVARFTYTIFSGAGRILDVLTTSKPIDPKAGPEEIMGPTAWTGQTASRLGVAPGVYAVTGLIEILRARRNLPEGFTIPDEYLGSTPPCENGNQPDVPTCIVDAVAVVGTIAVAALAPVLFTRYVKRSYVGDPAIYTNGLKVKFADSTRIVASPETNSFVSELSTKPGHPLPTNVQATLDAANALVATYGLVVDRTHVVSSPELRNFKAMGQFRQGKPLPDLSTWSLVAVGSTGIYPDDMSADDTATLASIVGQLNALDLVDTAYPASLGSGPTLERYSDTAEDIEGPTDDYTNEQWYLNPPSGPGTPFGLDVRYAWSVAGGRGENAEFVVIDSTRPWGHEDIPAFEYILHGNCPWRFGPGMANDCLEWGGDTHGVMVMGVIYASTKDSQLRSPPGPYGIDGIASRAAGGFASKWPVSPSAWFPIVERAVAKATQRMAVGGTMVIEHQHVVYEPFGQPGCWWCDKVPPTLDQAVLDAVETAVDNGMIVIEPAGNHGILLDHWRRYSEGTDSGSVLVASIDPFTLMVPGDSNDGDLVKVYSWGSRVATTGGLGTCSLPPTPVATSNEYTYCFNGTSSASALATGAAVILQSVHRWMHGSNASLTSRSMREILGRTGVRVYDWPYSGDKGAINLRAAIDSLDTLVWDFNEWEVSMAEWLDWPQAHEAVSMTTYSRGAQLPLRWPWCLHVGGEQRCPVIEDSQVYQGGKVAHIFRWAGQSPHSGGRYTPGTVWNLDFPGTVTVEALVRMPTAPQDVDAIIARKTDGSFTFGIEKATGRLFFSYITQSDVEQGEPATVCRRVSQGQALANNVNATRHLAVVHDVFNATITTYLDGNLDSWGADCGPKVGGGFGGDLEVGGGAFEGWIDHLLLRNRFTDQGEIWNDAHGGMLP